MFVHKFEHLGEALFGGFPEKVDVETVSVALSGAEEGVRLHAGLLQFLFEILALFRAENIVRTDNEERGRPRRVDVVRRGDLLDVLKVGGVGAVFFEDVTVRGAQIVVADVPHDVEGEMEVADGFGRVVHTAAADEEGGLDQKLGRAQNLTQRVVTGEGGDVGGEIAAGGVAGHADPVEVDGVLLGEDFQVVEGGDAVPAPLREGVFGRQTVVGVEDEIAVIGDHRAKTLAVFFVSADESAAVIEDDYGQFFAAVDQVLTVKNIRFADILAALVVDEVLFLRDRLKLFIVLERVPQRIDHLKQKFRTGHCFFLRKT